MMGHANLAVNLALPAGIGMVNLGRYSGRDRVQESPRKDYSLV
jgi:hypothetical protein